MVTTFRLILLFLSSASLLSQVGSWDNLPTLTEIRMILPLEDQILLATDGGLLSFDEDSESFSYGIDNMKAENFDVNTISIDEDNLLWIGSCSPGPVVEVIDLNTNRSVPVEFVELTEISSFVQVGDSVYATYQDDLEGGLLLYRKSANRIEYLDIFNNFPDQSNLDLTAVHDVTYLNGRLAFRTREEVLWVDLDGSNLKDPANWHVTSMPPQRTSINGMVSNGSVLRLAIDDAIYDYDFSQFTQLTSMGGRIIDLVYSNGNDEELVVALSSGIHTYNLSDGTSVQEASLSGIKHIASYSENIWISSNSDFLGTFSEQMYNSFSVNRPRDHFFNQMSIDAEGHLIGGAINGISIHSESGWRTIRPGNSKSAFDEDSYNWNAMIVDTLDYIGNAVVQDMRADQDGNVYLALQGRGVLKYDLDLPDSSKFLTPQNHFLEPTYNSDSYTLPGQIAFDSRDNVWFTTKLVRDGGSGLSIVTPEQEVYRIYQYQGGLDSRTIKSIAIDQNDLVWTGSQVWNELQAPGGIHLIEYPETLSDDMEIRVSSLVGGSLGDSEILQLEVDTHNTLWILTPQGVQSMILPTEWLNSTELRSWASLYMTDKTSDNYFYWQLTDYNVTAIEIDQRGNRWFLSSNYGVHVLQENGRWINGGYGYNTGNSGLLDNEVYSAAFDFESGQTYFSTPKGVSILNTPFATSKDNYSSIHIYPHPFNPDIHDQVIIQGLMDNSSVKILTISGALVRELTFLDNEVQGYEAKWDGKDAAGDIVGSGVYILYLFNEDGIASSQKLAVLR